MICYLNRKPYRNKDGQLLVRRDNQCCKQTDPKGYARNGCSLQAQPKGYMVNNKVKLSAVKK